MPSQSARVNFDRLLYTHYQHPSLKSARQFFLDFGLHITEEKENIVYFRGFGPNPCVYIAEQSPDSKKHFVAGGWLARSYEDLEKAAQVPGASKIQESDIPGKGQFVELVDPNGVKFRVHHGITQRAEAEQKKEIPKPVTFNTWVDKPRKGEFQRFDTGPSKVYKLGHYGLVVDRSRFDQTVAWYLETLGFAKTDALFDHDTGKDMMTFMHVDKGEDFVDHHSIFVQSPPFPVKGSHPHHCSFETDDMDSQLMGHYHLQAKKWTNCWGVGRHLLGSQIFDYWFDPSGNIVEHYSDGDLVNNKTEIAREVAAHDTMAVWGPNVTLAFLTTKMEDISKGAAPPEPKSAAVAS